MTNSKRTKLECIHADTCLPDYWSGHHLPYVQIPVWHGMKLKEIKQALLSELGEGAVMGNDENAFLLSADYVGPENADKADQVFKAAIASVNRIKPNKKGQRTFFKDLEPLDDNDDSGETVYAFFVFVELE